MFRLKVGECLITYSGWSLSRTEYPCGRFDISVLELGGYCCPDGLVFAESLAVSRMVRLYLISEYHFRLDSPSVEKFCGPFLNDGSQIMTLASCLGCSNITAPKQRRHLQLSSCMGSDMSWLMISVKRKPVQVLAPFGMCRRS